MSCPSDDLLAIAELLSRRPIALLPVGGVGDLAAAAGVVTLLLVEVTDEGPRSAITWRGELASSTPLEPDPKDLLPPSWVARHPDAYELSRAGRANEEQAADEVDGWDDWDDDERNAVQLFLPVTRLQQLPAAEWMFANELVPKQQRAGRRFAPRTPAVVPLPQP
jgi:hypothetical protein